MISDVWGICDYVRSMPGYWMYDKCVQVDVGKNLFGLSIRVNISKVCAACAYVFDYDMCACARMCLCVCLSVYSQFLRKVPSCARTTSCPAREAQRHHFNLLCFSFLLCSSFFVWHWMRQLLPRALGPNGFSALCQHRRLSSVGALFTSNQHRPREEGIAQSTLHKQKQQQNP